MGVGWVDVGVVCVCVCMWGECVGGVGGGVGGVWVGVVWVDVGVVCVCACGVSVWVVWVGVGCVNVWVVWVWVWVVGGQVSPCVEVNAAGRALGHTTPLPMLTVRKWWEVECAVCWCSGMEGRGRRACY